MTLLKPASHSKEYRVGPIAAEDRCVVFEPVRQFAPKNGLRPLAIICHGAGSDYSTAKHGPTTYLAGIICQMGFVVIVADVGDPRIQGNTSAWPWGHPNGADRLEAYRVWAGSNIALVDNSKMTVFGMSMGSQTCSSYAVKYPTRTAAIVVICPVFDNAWMRANRSDPVYTSNGFFATLVDNCWGLSSGDATPANCNFQTAIPVGTPWRSYTRTDDFLCNPARCDLLVARLGNGSKQESVGAGIRVVNNGVTTNNSNRVSSATLNASWKDREKKFVSSANVAANALITASPDGTHFDIGTYVGSDIMPLKATGNGSNLTFTIGEGHDETIWSQIDYDDLLSWLLPYALT